MTQTKTAMGNLANRYRAVLKKCHILNTFGSLALYTSLALGIVGGGFALEMATPNEAQAEIIQGSAKRNPNTDYVNKTNGGVAMSAGHFFGETMENKATLRVIRGGNGVDNIGMNGSSGKNAIFYNEGDIIISAPDVDPGDAIGMRAGGPSFDTLMNNEGGDIYVSDGKKTIGMFIDGSGGSIINNGKISAFLHNGPAGTSPTYADAYGMHAEIELGEVYLLNFKTINVEKEWSATSQSSHVYGMSAVNKGSDHFKILANAGTIKVSGVNGNYGMYSSALPSSESPFSTFAGDTSMVNTGFIDVRGDSNSYAMYATSATATSTVTNTLTNGGDIIAYADSNAYGMQAYGRGENILRNTDDGTIRAEGERHVRGMSAMGNGVNSVTNQGGIDVKGWGDASDSIYGIYLEGDAENTVVQEGLSHINVEGVDQVYGIYVQGSKSNTVLNDGNIFSKSDKMTAISVEDGTKNTIKNTGLLSLDGDGSIGMSIDNTGNLRGEGLVENSGSIRIKSYGTAISAQNFQNMQVNNNGGFIAVLDYDDQRPQGSSASYGIYLNSQVGSANITNTDTGSITVVSYSDPAYGIYVDANSLDIDNKGVIQANSYKSNSYELYAAGRTNVTVKDWQTHLVIPKEEGQIGQRFVFGGEQGTSIYFDNGTFIPRVDSGLKFAYGKQYAIADLIDVSTDSQGVVSGPTINGAFGSVETEHPYLRATLHGGTQDVMQQSVSVFPHIRRGNNPFSIQSIESVNQILRAVGSSAMPFQGGRKKSSGFVGVGAGSDYVDMADTKMGEKRWHAFFTPLGNYTNNSEYDYHGYTAGVSGGLTYAFNDSFSLGSHFFITNGKSDMNIFDMETESFSAALGLHATYNITPEWYTRAQVMGIYGKNESDYALSDLGLSGYDEYDNAAFYGSLHTGYVWKINENNSITPEIGISYLGMNMNSFNMNFQGAGYTGGYDTKYDDVTYNGVYAEASVRYDGDFAVGEKGDSFLRPSIGVGVRQILGGDDIESSLVFLEDRYTTHADMASTTVTANAGIEFVKGDFSIGLEYYGEYDEHRTSHGGMMNLNFKF